MLQENIKHGKQVGKIFSENHIAALIANEKERVFNKGDLVCTASQANPCFFIVKEGYLCNFHIYIDGKECIIGLLSAGDVIGFENIFTDKKSNVFYRALTSVKVVALSGEKLKQLITIDPALSLTLLQYFSESQHDMIETLEQISYGTVENRLLFLFKKLVDLGQKRSGWYPIPISLTHKDIAGMIGSTRETVTLTINKLLKTGDIKRLENILWMPAEKIV